jgi:hypothetical protein
MEVKRIAEPVLTRAVPKEALAMIRYHSFYPWHREGAYRHLMNDDDWESLKAVKAFNREWRMHPFIHHHPFRHRDTAAFIIAFIPT